MANILLLYSSTDGHTVKISDYLSQLLINNGNEVTTMPIADAVEDEFDVFDVILIGAAIRYGKHRPEVYQFITNNRNLLQQKLSGFFSVCLVARKANKNMPHTNPYYKKFLQRSGWTPKLMAVFAGKINYPLYSLPDRLMIQFIMWLTKGPTASHTVHEFTDWQAVDRFATEIQAAIH